MPRSCCSYGVNRQGVSRTMIFGGWRMPWLPPRANGLMCQSFFLRSVRRYFSAIRCYHGCRTQDPEAYFAEGIRPLNAWEIVDHARRIFLSGNFPEISSRIFENAVYAALKSGEAPEVFFTPSRSCQLRRCGHYLLYGSERITAIAVKIAGGTRYDYRQALKLFGKPTLWVCDARATSLSDRSLGSFTNAMLAAWHERLVIPNHRFECSGGFAISGTLSPDAIVRMELLDDQDILDPFRNDAPSFTTAPWQRQNSPRDESCG